MPSHPRSAPHRSRWTSMGKFSDDFVLYTSIALSTSPCWVPRESSPQTHILNTNLPPPLRPVRPLQAPLGPCRRPSRTRRPQPARGAWAGCQSQPGGSRSNSGVEWSHSLARCVRCPSRRLRAISHWFGQGNGWRLASASFYVFWPRPPQFNFPSRMRVCVVGGDGRGCRWLCCRTAIRDMQRRRAERLR
jgi:hypothetical protein